ncbi:TPA: hypothetical protein QB229_002215, partial [Pasteurella multocida]|nr:hypothetical protein [Pasteurella multocida]
MNKKSLSEEQINFNQAQGKLARKTSVKCCFWEDDENDECSDKIISAHSIQRGKILEKISDNGEVYHLSAFPNDDLSKMEVIFRKEGIKKFSTFSGFCGKHDKEVFQNIEDSSFSSKESQMHTYAYRAVTKELHAQMVSKNKMKELLGDKLDGECPLHFLLMPIEESLPSYIKEKIQKEIALHKIRCRYKQSDLNIKELNSIANHLKSVILDKEQSLITHILYAFEQEYPIACSSVFIQYHDLDGNKILSCTQSDSLENKSTILNIFPENGKTYIIFSIFKEHTEL